MVIVAHPSPPLSPYLAALALLAAGALSGGILFGPGACLLAIAAAWRRQHPAMLLWYGAAVGCDAHALLVAPLFVALAIERRIAPRLLVVVPLVAAALLVLRGSGAPGLSLPHDLALSHGAPSLWTIAQAVPQLREVPLAGLALTLAIGAAAAYIAWFSARPLSGRAMLDAALLCALVMPMSLPGIDRGAFVLAVALAGWHASVAQTAQRWRVAGLVLAGALLAGVDALAPLGAVAMLLATVLHARAVLTPAANDNPLMPRTA